MRIENGVVCPVQLGFVNVYFIKTKNGYILVDAGMPGRIQNLDKVFASAGVDTRDVHLIIITHAHMDHVGLLAYAKEVTGARIVCHESLLKKLINGETEIPVAQNWRGQFLNLMTSILELTGGAKIKGVHPDILVQDNFDLVDFGISGKVIHTPGHSLGSISIILDNGEILIGDMVRNEGKGKIGLGMFYEDKDMLLKSLETVAAVEPRTIYPSHGTSIDNDALKNAIASIKNDFRMD